MRKILKNMTQNKSTSPGTITYIGDEKQHNVKIKMISYNDTAIDEFDVTEPDKMNELKTDKNKLYWINIDGIHDVHLLEKTGNTFNIHPLTLEDIANTTQRPKYEEYDEYLYYVIKMIYFDETEKIIKNEQVSFILTENLVISFQEREGDVFEPLRNRLRQNKGRVRKMKSDYLFYILIDAIIDNYFLVIEKIGDNIDVIDEALINNAEKQMIHKIHELKKEILHLRKSLWPLRDVNNALYRMESSFITGDIRIFLRDLYDHTIQVVDTLETYQYMVSGIMDHYLSVTSNKLNEIMKVLTIFASLFIPLTFIAGWYGMNFKHMPEVDSPYAYPVIIIITIGCIIGMIFYFRRKKWLGKSKQHKKKEK